MTDILKAQITSKLADFDAAIKLANREWEHANTAGDRHNMSRAFSKMTGIALAAVLNLEWFADEA